MIKKKDYVWYAAYGSNINEDRFLCYIKGGKPKGGNKRNPGCSNKSLPLKSKKIVINHQLYFAKKSNTWDNGGVAFIKTKPSKQHKTLGKMYLITREQFEEIVTQENNNKAYKINFKKLLSRGSQVINKEAWYGNILHLGYHKNAPIFTFTNKEGFTKLINTPSEGYLGTIVNGIYAQHKLSKTKIANYIKTLKGVKGNISQKNIIKLLK